MLPVFLTAEWRHLVMASYAVPPELLLPLVPPGTELDFTGDGRTFVSLVGFRFLNTRLLGGRVRVPWHADFPEVNLRFYVRRRDPGSPAGDDGWRRGTVFIREIVPLPAVVLVARVCYGERYLARPMRDELDGGDDARRPDRLAFRWRAAGAWNALRAACAPAEGWRDLGPGSLEEWIAEHYFGYAARRRFWQSRTTTTEYGVEHPRWRVRPVERCTVDLPAGESLYGDAMAERLRGRPDNVFVAEGSPILIRQGVKLDA